MRPRIARLFLALAIAVLAWLAVLEFGQVRSRHPRATVMLSAVDRLEQALAVVDSAKRAKGVRVDDESPVPWRALLGSDYTFMTTTLGSREAKEVSTNPAWAAVLVGLLDACGVAAGDTVAVLASGSFPALSLAAGAALAEIGAAPLLVSSVGASSYGANQPGATWLDIESWVDQAGVFPYHSSLVTIGGENDTGGGLDAEGIRWIEEAAQRNETSLTRFETLEDAIEARMQLLAATRPAAVLNIGGGQASLGRCSHAATLPVGIWRRYPGCDCEEQGVLPRVAELGIPVIHLLNIRRLAALYGLDIAPGGRYENGDITETMRPRRGWILAAIAAIGLSLSVRGRTEP